MFASVKNLLGPPHAVSVRAVGTGGIGRLGTLPNELTQQIVEDVGYDPRELNSLTRTSKQFKDLVNIALRPINVRPENDPEKLNGLGELNAQFRRLPQEVRVVLNAIIGIWPFPNISSPIEDEDILKLCSLLAAAIRQAKAGEMNNARRSFDLLGLHARDVGVRVPNATDILLAAVKKTFLLDEPIAETCLVCFYRNARAATGAVPDLRIFWLKFSVELFWNRHETASKYCLELLHRGPFYEF